VAEILFEWDEANVEHIARHGYDPDEVEEVFEGKFKIRKGRESAYICYGSTLDGRLAFIVFKRFGGARIRVITARDMEDNERRTYRRNNL
jgi:uncharacterized DUF497 family protein